MNWDTWNNLSDNQKAALDAIGGTYWANGWDTDIAERTVDAL